MQLLHFNSRKMNHYDYAIEHIYFMNILCSHKVILTYLFMFSHKST